MGSAQETLMYSYIHLNRVTVSQIVLEVPKIHCFIIYFKERLCRVPIFRVNDDTLNVYFFNLKLRAKSY